MTRPALLVIGRICRDEILELDAWPAPDTKTHINASLMSVGGNAARAAICAAALGAQVSLAGRLGDDAAGHFCLERLNAAGVDTSLVKIIAGGATPHSHVLVSGAARTVLAQTNRLEPLELSNALLNAASRASILLLDPAAAHLAAKIKTVSAAALVYDHEPANYDQAELFKLADWFAPSRASLNGALGIKAALAELAEKIAGHLIVTAGADGAYYLAEGRIMRVAAPAVKVRDTTGAGDNFHAALAVALARGAGLEQAVRCAVASASLSCERLGCPPPMLDAAFSLAAGLTVEQL